MGRPADAEPPLLQAYMAESDANPDNCAAKTDALGQLARESTPAEYGAAVEAAKRFCEGRNPSGSRRISAFRIAHLGAQLQACARRG